MLYGLFQPSKKNRCDEGTCLGVGEEQVLLSAGNRLEDHLEVLHIVGKGTLRFILVNVIIAMINREHANKFVETIEKIFGEDGILRKKLHIKNVDKTVTIRKPLL